MRQVTYVAAQVNPELVEFSQTQKDLKLISSWDDSYLIPESSYIWLAYKPVLKTGRIWNSGPIYQTF